LEETTVEETTVEETKKKNFALPSLQRNSLDA
jgi:hypothetical protein